MQQITDISLVDTIIPYKGIGELILGMNCYYIRDIFTKNFQSDKTESYLSQYDHGDWESRLDTPFFQFFTLSYKESLEIDINLFTGNIASLKVKNSYVGKILGKAGIGDKTRVIFDEYKKEFYEFNEGGFFFWIKHNKKKYGLNLLIGNEYEYCLCDKDFEKYLDLPIREIGIFDDSQRLGIGQNLPDSFLK